jgi:DNA-directed RNA polymerase specialized sigma24 family protein
MVGRLTATLVPAPAGALAEGGGAAGVAGALPGSTARAEGQAAGVAEGQRQAAETQAAQQAAALQAVAVAMQQATTAAAAAVEHASDALARLVLAALDTALPAASDARETHRALKTLSQRLQNTVAVHYCMKLPLWHQAERLGCAVDTVHGRIEAAHRALAAALDKVSSE